jgi:hypothetical protein
MRYEVRISYREVVTRMCKKKKVVREETERDIQILQQDMPRKCGN